MERRKKRILFVSGPTPEMAELRTEFAALTAAYWETHLAESGLDALDFLQETDCNAVVTDLRLEDVSGMQVLNFVARHQIRSQRIVLADLGDIQSLLRCVGGVHQFLIKPCEASRLQHVLERTQRMDVWLPSIRVHELVGRLPKLPSPPSSYHGIVELLQRDQPARREISTLLARDPVMTAKLLQLVNSAAYGDPVDEGDPLCAFNGQGLDTIKGLLLLSHQFSHFNATQGSGFSPDGLWRHSQLVSRLAGWIAELETEDESVRRNAVTAGLLHDIGKVAIAANLPRQFNEAQFYARAQQVPFWEAESHVLGATHAEIGGCLLGTWGLPLAIVEAVTLHHHPTRLLSSRFSALTAVHVADAFDHASNLEQAQRQVERSYLESLRLWPRLPVWWEECQRRIRSLQPAEVSHA